MCLSIGCWRAYHGCNSAALHTGLTWVLSTSGLLLRCSCVDTWCSDGFWEEYIFAVCTGTSGWRSCSADAYCQKYCNDFRSAFRGISDLFFLRGANVSSGTWRSQASIAFLAITKPRPLTAIMRRGFCAAHKSNSSWDAVVSVYVAISSVSTKPRCLILHTQVPLMWAEHLNSILLWSCLHPFGNILKRGLAPSGRNSFASNNNWQEAEN